MRNLIKAGFAVLVAGMVTLSACSSNNSNNGAGGSTGAGSGGASGTGGVTGTDAGSDAPVGTGGTPGTGGSAGTGGAGGAAANPHQDHLNIINKSTTGGVPITRSAPVAYDSCKI